MAAISTRVTRRFAVKDGISSLQEKKFHSDSDNSKLSRQPTNQNSYQSRKSLQWLRSSRRIPRLRVPRLCPNSVKGWCAGSQCISNQNSGMITLQRCGTRCPVLPRRSSWRSPILSAGRLGGTGESHFLSGQNCWPYVNSDCMKHAWAP